MLVKDAKAGFCFLSQQFGLVVKVELWYNQESNKNMFLFNILFDDVVIVAQLELNPSLPKSFRSFPRAAKLIRQLFRLLIV